MIEVGSRFCASRTHRKPVLVEYLSDLQITTAILILQYYMNKQSCIHSVTFGDESTTITAKVQHYMYTTFYQQISPQLIWQRFVNPISLLAACRPAAESNNTSDLHPLLYCIATAPLNPSRWCCYHACACACVLSVCSNGRPPEVVSVVVLKAGLVRMWATAAIQFYRGKMRTGVHPSCGIDVQQDKVDPCVTEATVLVSPPYFSSPTSITVEWVG